MKNKLKRLEPTIRAILEEEPDTRSDDMLLYYTYASRTINAEFEFSSLFTWRQFREECKIAPFESVSRCRRKIQANEPHLRPSKKAHDAREAEEGTYIEYATN